LEVTFIENKGLLDMGGQKLAKIDRLSAEVGLAEVTLR
jgi:hypothetical protein